MSGTRAISTTSRRELSSSFFFPPARHGAEGNSRHSDRNISFFPLLVGLRTYQHPLYLLVTFVIFIPRAGRLTTLFSTLKIFCHPFTVAVCNFLEIRVDAFRNSRPTSGRATNSFFCFVPPVISIQTLFLQSLLFAVSCFLFFSQIFFSFLDSYGNLYVTYIFPGY